MAGGNFDLPGFRGFACSALGLSGLVLGIFWFRITPKVEPSHAQLVAALGPLRLSEGRFSGGFQYAPFHGSSHIQLRNKSLKRFYREFEAELNHHPTQDIRVDFAILNLAFGKTDEALDQLNQVASAHPERAEALSDLAAFWLARSDLSRDPNDLIRALDAADRAVRLKSKLPEAWFNLAVAQERLFLTKAAARSWIAYLTLDEGSAWAWEARAKLAKARGLTERQLWERESLRLEQAVLNEDEAVMEGVVRRFPLPARIWVEEELLPQWGKAELAGQEQLADLLLRGAGHVAACHARITGDSLLSESVEAIKAAQGTVQISLAHGHVLFAAGRKAYNSGRPEEAESLFSRALNAFEQGSSTFSLWADLSLAICRFEDRDFRDALEQLSSLIHRANPHRYLALSARANWIRGMVQFARGEPTLSLRDFQEALAYLSGTRSVEDEGAIHYLIAANLSYLGDYSQAWRHLYQALAATPGTIHERRLFSAFDEAGTLLERAGEVRAALYFRNAVITLSRVSELPDPTGLAHAYLRRAESRWKVGDEAAARADLHQARLLARKIDSPGLQQDALAKIDIAEAETVASPERALSLSEEALSYYLRLGSYFDLPRVHLARYRALRSMGRMQEAIVALEQGILEFEQVRERVVDEGERASYFDRARQIFNIMIKLQYDIGRPEMALWYTERERSRDLLDLLALTNKDQRAASVLPLEPHALAMKVPIDSCVIEFRVLEDRLLVWVVRRNRIISLSINIKGSDLERRVHALRSSLSDGKYDSQSKSGLEDIYDLIIRPAEPYLYSVGSIVFVPDGLLSGVPFAALYDRARGQYLIEKWVVSISPSTSFYLGRGALHLRKGSGHPSVLAVGASQFDRRVFPKLSSLKYAEGEAKAIVGLYARRSLLLGKAATRDGFLSSYGKYEVVHFAGHTIGVPGVPAASIMLFAPSSPDDSGVLGLGDLSLRGAARTRIMILSSCSSGVNWAESSGIGIGFVHSFLASGVNAVIASLWDINDDRVQALSVRLHVYISEGVDAAYALQRAQIDMIHSREENLSSPIVWANLQVFKGGAFINTNKLQEWRGEK